MTRALSHRGYRAVLRRQKEGTNMNKIKLTVFTAAVFLFSTGTSARPIRPPFPAPFPSFDTTSVNTSVPVSIADDFTPVQSGLLSNVSFVGSWEYNNMDEFKAIHIGIMDDIDGKPGKEFWGTYVEDIIITPSGDCLLYTSPSPRD